MTKSSTLPVNDGKIRETVNSFLKELFTKKAINAMLVPLSHPAGISVVQALVTNLSFLDRADVFAPVMPVNSARMVQALTRLTPVTGKPPLLSDLAKCALSLNWSN